MKAKDKQTMTNLWNKEEEIKFFLSSLKSYKPNQLFYLSSDNRYYAYWPKSYKGRKSTLQSRNAVIGAYTENFVASLLSPFAKKNGWNVVQKAVCDEIGCPRMSPADLAICKTPSTNQSPDSILAVIEVKMSLVWNWEYKKDSNELMCIGDYSSHQGTPGLLRSDSMLKAIGKSINIRVSGDESKSIPIIIIGNTPITKHYENKVDHLKSAGIIQGFWSLNPDPFDNGTSFIRSTPQNGFITFNSYPALIDNFRNILEEKRLFFSSMKTKQNLGKIIEEASKIQLVEGKAEKFLSLLKEYNE